MNNLWRRKIANGFCVTMWKGKIVRMLFITMCLCSLVGIRPTPVWGQELLIESPSVILLEASTGVVLYEQNADVKRHPASVTKVMTLLLIFEELQQGRMHLEDIVTISPHAASMGGSQCFFEAGEQMSVEDMIKCIIIASGNDAAVAMGEHIAGSEEAFVKRMNERARELGMNNTTFENACGLDGEQHLTTARDISLMSRELVTKHPEIFTYSTIWMDTILHVTPRGTSEFGLSNTNKLLKQYPYCNGLKTGYTSEAGFSIAATADNGEIQLIAVVMGGETKEQRNQDVCRLFDYGFANCQLYCDENLQEEYTLKVKGGQQYTVNAAAREQEIKLVLTKEQQGQEVVKEVKLMELQAPIKQGDCVGEVVYSIEGEIIGNMPIVAKDSVDTNTYGYSYLRALHAWLQQVKGVHEQTRKESS